MNFARLASYLQKLESTSGRLEMTAILAELFKEAGAAEIDKICFLSLGRLAPLYEGVEFNLADKMMVKVLARAYDAGEEMIKAEYKKVGDLGVVAETLNQKSKIKNQKLTVGEVYSRLYEIASASGLGSQEKKIALFVRLLKEVDPLSSRYLTRIPLGKMRLGFSDKTVIEALSWMERGDKSLKEGIEKAYFVYPNIGEIARRFRQDGLSGLAKVKPRVGVPILAQLCQRGRAATEIIEKVGGGSGGEVVVEPKFDGTRVQLHLDRNQKSESEGQKLEMELAGFSQPKFLVKTFTRNLEDTTAMFPDLIEAAGKQIKAKSAILDGEAVGVDPKTGKMRPFQETAQRKRKYEIAVAAAKIPLRLYLFDLLFLDGDSLLEKPFCERRRALEKVAAVAVKDSVLQLTPQEVVTDPRVLDKSLAKAQAQGLEGLVVKKPDASYEAGSRGFSWVKYKREEGAAGDGGLADTIDAVVLGYYKGAGKRADFGIGAFLVGVYEEEKDRFLTAAKIGTGLTDEQWVEMRKRCDGIKMGEPPKNVVVEKALVPDVWVKPSMVVVIRADEVTRSPVHSAGYALRFPRLIAWRDDKSAEEATTLKEILSLFRMQKRKPLQKS